MSADNAGVLVRLTMTLYIPGFYSLFSITEEPFVTSGGQWMGFYWKDKKDQLFARRGTRKAPAPVDGVQWTAFEMPLREPAPLPVLFDLARFLASSLTFMANLCEVSVFFDGHRVARLRKSAGTPANMQVPMKMNKKCPAGIMTVTGLKSSREWTKMSVMGLFIY